MLSRFTPLVARTAARSRFVAAPLASRSFSSVGHTTAAEAAAMSGYSNIEFRIDEDAMVIEAVQQFAANNIGCLVTVNDSGMLLFRTNGAPGSNGNSLGGDLRILCGTIRSFDKFCLQLSILVVESLAFAIQASQLNIAFLSDFL